MDCVGCDKCRLWGKVQTTGVAAALKIGWGLCVHFCEHGLDTVEGGKLRQIGINADGQKEELREAGIISKLEELRVVWSDLFKPKVDTH